MDYRIILLLEEVSVYIPPIQQGNLKDKFITSLIKRNLKTALKDKRPMIQGKLVQKTIFGIINKKIHHKGIEAALSNLKMERDGTNMVRVSMDVNDPDYKGILKTLDLETIVKDEKGKEIVRTLKSMEGLQDRMIDGLFENVKNEEINQVVMKAVNLYQSELLKLINRAIPLNLSIAVQGLSVEEK